VRRIEPTAIYASDELKEILRGCVKVETLREFGLIGSPGSGYWGRNVVDSLDKYWDHLACQRGTGKVMRKENRLVANKAKRSKVQDGAVHAPRGEAGKVESERKRFQWLVSENPLQRQGLERSHEDGGRDAAPAASEKA